MTKQVLKTRSNPETAAQNISVPHQSTQPQAHPQPPHMVERAAKKISQPHQFTKPQDYPQAPHLVIGTLCWSCWETLAQAGANLTKRLDGQRISSLQVLLALNYALLAGITFVDASIVHCPSPNTLLYPRLRNSRRDMYVC